MQTSDYRTLLVWQKAMNITVEVYALTKYLPREETYVLSDQMRRAVVSVPSNIAEGHGRGSSKEFIKFLFIAKGSLLELETQIEIAKRLGYFNEIMTSKVNSMLVEESKMINALIGYYKSQISKETKN